MSKFTPKPPLQLKLLTLNTHKGFSSFNRRFVLHELRDAVRASGADIVFLQEVLGKHEKHSRRVNWPPTSQYEFLADSIWSDFAYGQNAVYTSGHHGNAVLSKFPILRHENHDVSIPRSRERRGLLHCVIDLRGAGTQLHAICAHLGLAESHRRWQLERMCQLVDAAVPPDAPLIVAGDFNDWRLRASPTLERCAGLLEVFLASDGNVARTFPARWPLLRLDRIYVRNARVLRTEVLSALPWSHLSDHAALAAEVELAGQHEPVSPRDPGP